MSGERLTLRNSIFRSPAERQERGDQSEENRQQADGDQQATENEPKMFLGNMVVEISSSSRRERGDRDECRGRRDPHQHDIAGRSDEDDGQDLSVVAHLEKEGEPESDGPNLAGGVGFRGSPFARLVDRGGNSQYLADAERNQNQPPDNLHPEQIRSENGLGTISDGDRHHGGRREADRRPNENVPRGVASREGDDTEVRLAGKLERRHHGENHDAFDQRVRVRRPCLDSPVPRGDETFLRAARGLLLYGPTR